MALYSWEAFDLKTPNGIPELKKNIFAVWIARKNRSPKHLQQLNIRPINACLIQDTTNNCGSIDLSQGNIREKAGNNLATLLASKCESTMNVSRFCELNQTRLQTALGRILANFKIDTRCCSEEHI